MSLILLGILNAQAAGGVSNHFFAGYFLPSTTSSSAFTVSSDSDGIYVGTEAGVTVKLDHFGNIVWSRKLSRGIFERATGIGTDSSGNVYTFGMSNKSGGGRDFTVAKYNSSGVIQLQRTAGSGTAFVGSNKSFTDSSGTTVGVGNGTTSRMQLVEYDTSGTKTRDVRINTGASATLNGVKTSGSDTYVVGTQSSTTAGGDDGYIAKLSGTSFVWQRRYGGASTESFQDIAVDESGNSYVIGEAATGSSSTNGDVNITKWNSSGTLQWQRNIGLSGNNVERGLSIAIDPTGDILVFAASTRTGGSWLDYFVFKLDSSGTLIFQRKITDGGNAPQGQLSCDADGNIIYAGALTVDSGPRAVVAKLPNDGSKTGTYSIGSKTFVYEAASQTMTTPTYTTGTTSFTISTNVLTSSASSLTDSAETLTPVITYI